MNIRGLPDSSLPADVRWGSMRDKRTPKDVGGEATLIEAKLTDFFSRK